MAARIERPMNAGPRAARVAQKAREKRGDELRIAAGDVARLVRIDAEAKKARAAAYDARANICALVNKFIVATPSKLGEDVKWRLRVAPWRRLTSTNRIAEVGESML